LDARQRAAAVFLAGESGNVVSEFTEVESGRKADRPELERAMIAG